MPITPQTRSGRAPEATGPGSFVSPLLAPKAFIAGNSAESVPCHRHRTGALPRDVGSPTAPLPAPYRTSLRIGSVASDHAARPVAQRPRRRDPRHKSRWCRRPKGLQPACMPCTCERRVRDSFRHLPRKFLYQSHVHPQPNVHSRQLRTSTDPSPAKDALAFHHLADSHPNAGRPACAVRGVDLSLAHDESNYGARSHGCTGRTLRCAWKLLQKILATKEICTSN